MRFNPVKPDVKLNDSWFNQIELDYYRVNCSVFYQVFFYSNLWWVRCFTGDSYGTSRIPINWLFV